MLYLKKIIKILLWTVTGFVSFLILYFISVLLLTWWPANSDFKAPSTGVDIYIRSNGVHTDVIVPARNEVIDWTKMIDTTEFKKMNNSIHYISFGWGDKGFYLNTPDWADLKFSTAFNAMFMLSTTAMHVAYQDRVPTLTTNTRKIIITREQYLQMCTFINKSFQQNEGKVMLIKDHHYEGVNDNFYEAKGTYSLFYTCNTWANNTLKSAGIKTAHWAPFDKCIFYHF
jgi:uncharacterized protein (TIGR02117 family)